MLRFLKKLSRVLLGFLFACLVAGIATVLFVDTPIEIASAPGIEAQSRARQALELALLTATHSAVFSFIFAMIAAIIAEWLSVRSLPYYLLAGTGIALLGFLAQYQSEVSGQPTILNNYALKAFLTAGFFAGFTYWLVAGRYSGRLPDDPEAEASAPPPSPPPAKANPEGSAEHASTTVRGALGRRPVTASRRVMPSVSSRIIDITADNSERAAFVAAAAARAAAESLRESGIERTQRVEKEPERRSLAGSDDRETFLRKPPPAR